MDVRGFLDGEHVLAADVGEVSVREEDGGYQGGCGHCGEFVSAEFKRVFATNQGEIYACPSCSPNQGIAETQRERLDNPEKYDLDL